MSYTVLKDNSRKHHESLRFENLVLDGTLTVSGGLVTPSSTFNLNQDGTAGEIIETTSGNFILSFISPTGDKRAIFICAGDGVTSNDFNKFTATGSPVFHIGWVIGENIKPYYSASYGAGVDIITYTKINL